MRNLVLSIAFCLITSFASNSFAEEKKTLKFEKGDTLEEIRAKIKHNGYSFTVDKNWVSEMSESQKAKFFGRRTNKPAKRIAFTVGPLGNKRRATLPTSFDWRSKDGKSYIGAIKNQGTCGSCYSFGACAAAEGTYNYATGKYDTACVDFSESYIAWCLSTLEQYKSHFYGCEGGDYDYMELTALTKKGLYPQYDGAAYEKDCPYSETAVTASDYLGKIPTVQFESWSRVYPANYDDTTQYMKEAIYTYGVIDVAVNVGKAFEVYSGGIYEDSNTTTTDTPYYNALTNHAVALVGWDDNPAEGGGGCWILRNSWGDSWGESGYMRIRYKSAYVNCAAAYFVYDSSGATSITVGSPNGGEVWAPGAEKSVTWSSSGVTGNVKIELYKTGALDSVISAATDVSAGTYTWTIPSAQANGSDYTVKITSADDSVSDSSDASFAITSNTTCVLTMAVSPASSGTTTPAAGTSTVNLGEAQTITATAASGYKFSSWSATTNAFLTSSSSSSTTVTLIDDATVTAIFEAVSSFTIPKLDISLDNTATGKDKVGISKAQYPSTASESVTSATVVIDGATFTCDSSTGEWSEKSGGSKLSFKSTSKSPKVQMTIDLTKDIWTFKATKASINGDVKLYDGVEITLKINGTTVGVTSLDYSDLSIKSKVKYKQ